MALKSKSKSKRAVSTKKTSKSTKGRETEDKENITNVPVKVSKPKKKREKKDRKEKKPKEKNPPSPLSDEILLEKSEEELIPTDLPTPTVQQANNQDTSADDTPSKIELQQPHSVDLQANENQLLEEKNAATSIEKESTPPPKTQTLESVMTPIKALSLAADHQTSTRSNDVKHLCPTPNMRPPMPEQLVEPSPMTRVMLSRGQNHYFMTPKPTHGIRYDSEDDDDILLNDSPTKATCKNRLSNRIVAFFGKFKTSAFDLQRKLSEEGGVNSSIKASNPPPHFVVLSDSVQLEKFLQKYRDFIWLANSIFVNESKFLRIVEGLDPVPIQNTIETQQLLELHLQKKQHEEESESLDINCSKRKERPPSTPKKVKPFFSFEEQSPERKKGKIERSSSITLTGGFKFLDPQSSLLSPSQIGFKGITEIATPKPPKLAPTEKMDFTGKRFVLLGKFTKSKNELQDLITSNGGEIPKSGHISAKVSYLLCGTGAAGTVKYQTAQSKGIQIIFEDDFLEMMGQKTEN